MAENKVEIKISADAAQAASAMRDMSNAITQATNSAKTSIVDMGNAAVTLGGTLQQTASTARTSFDSMGDAASASERHVKSLTSSADGLKNALSGVAVAAAAKNILDTGLRYESLAKALKAITGSSEGAASELAFLRVEADRVGLNFLKISDAYKSFAASAIGTKLAGQGVRDIFIGLIEKASELGLKTETVESIFRALGQMMSKGSIQREDLVGQLGEHLPGALRLLSSAMGISNAEMETMMKKGELLSEDVLPKLGKGLHESSAGSVADSAKSAQAQINRLNNAIDDLKLALADTSNMKTFADALNAALMVVRTMTTGVLTLVTGLRQLGMAAGAAMASLHILGTSVNFSQATDSIGEMVSGIHEIGMTKIGDSMDNGIEKVKKGFSSFGVLNKNAAQEVKSIWANFNTDVQNSTQDLADTVARLWNPPKTAPPAKWAQGTPQPEYTDPDKAVKKYKEALEEERAVAITSGKLKEWTHAMDVAYWKQKIATVKEGTDVYKEVQKELGKAMEKAIKEEERAGRKGAGDAKRAAAEEKREAREAYEAKIHTLRAELDAYKHNASERVRIAKEMAQVAAEMYGQGSVQHMDMIRQVQAAEREEATERKELAEVESKRRRDHAIAQLDMEAANINLLRQLGKIKAEQEITMLKDVNARKAALYLEDLQTKLSLEKESAVKRAQIEAEIAAKRNEINKQIQESDNKLRLETHNKWKQMGDSIVSSLSGAIKGMLFSTKSFTESIRDLFQNMVGTVIDALIKKMVNQWILGETTKTSATAAGEAARTGIQTAGAATGLATQASTGLTGIMNNAYKAAAGAYASASEIYGIGWLLAPIAAAAAFTAVAAFGGGLASAAGGWGEVDRDQLAMVHKREMILPAPIADTVRAMAGSTLPPFALPSLAGYSMGGGMSVPPSDSAVSTSRPLAVTYNVHAMDSRDVGKFFRRNSKSLTKTINRSARNFELRRP